MRRVKLMIGGLLMGAILGALAVWMGSGSSRPGAGSDSLIAGSRQVCEAIVTDDDARWEAVRGRFFSDGADGARLLKVAKTQSLYFGKGSRIEGLRRSA